MPIMFLLVYNEGGYDDLDFTCGIYASVELAEAARDQWCKDKGREKDIGRFSVEFFTLNKGHSPF